MKIGRLQRRTIGIVAAASVGLFVALYLPLRVTLLDHYAGLEAQIALRDVERAENALATEVEQLNAVVEDHAQWDDTIAFLHGEQPDYVETNFESSTFDSARIDYVFILDLEDRPHLAMGWDHEEDVPREAPPLAPLLEALGGARAQGVIRQGDGLTIAASAPVVRTNLEGPPQGRVVMGRFVDAAEVERLGAVTRLPLTLTALGEDGPSRAAVEAAERSIETPSDALLVGHGRVADPTGAPVAVLRYEAPRAIYAQGLEGATALLVALVVAVLIFGVLFLVLVDRVVLRRVVRLQREVERLADHAGRVRVRGSDEIADLATSINGMLGGLEGLTRDLQEERDRSEALLLNILPEAIAQRLKDDRATIADQFAEASVLFADLVGFTALSATTAPEELVQLLNEIFSAFDALAERHGLEKIKTIGDAYMVVAGLPEPREDHADALVRMGLDMLDEVEAFNARQGTALAMRIGVNSGAVVAGVIGQKKFIYDLWGDTVNVASRMESGGVAGRVQIAAGTHDRLASRWPLEARTVRVKGKGELPAWLVLGPPEAS